MAQHGHGPVNNQLAEACFKNYHEIFKQALDPKIKDAFTSDIIFDRLALIAWLQTLTSDSVQISMGVYTPEFVAAYPTAKLGRMSAFITPYNTPGSLGGPPPPPPDDGTFNLGNLLP